MMLRLIIIAVLLLHQYSDAQQLIASHIIFRHGERAPGSLYPTDTNDPFFWPNGLGQLTVRGKLQHIYFGQYLRERYSSLLNTTYVAAEITIRSSDYDRTLMSAYSNLVGLYSSPDDIELSENFYQTFDWPEQLPWQPIPVHTVPKPLDHLMGVSTCDRYEELVDELRESQRIQSLNREFHELMEYLEEHTDQEVDDIFVAWDVADAVLIEDIYNVTPAWVTPSILQQLRQLQDLCFFHLFYPPEINRLRGGPLIRDILQNIGNLKSKNGEARKVKIYSGHDTTIAPILAFLDVNHPHQPPFASALFFDVYQYDNNSYAIQLEYSNMTNGRNPHIVLIPGCEGAMCSLDTFIELFEAKLPVDMNKECQSTRIKRSYPRVHRISYASD